jgi:3',5'-cyclic-AMP phosphodiesterase
MKRRQFIKNSLMLITGAGIATHATAASLDLLTRSEIILRFAVASDGHYGQAGTNFDADHDEMMDWLRQEHQQQTLSFCMFNGDLIQDDPTLFSSVKKKYDSLQIPYYVSRGNHDRCDASTWKQAWGHDLDYSFEIAGNAFVVLDTSNISGEYVCPNVKLAKRKLDAYRRSENIFVFMHIPLKPWTKNAIDCPQLTDLFSKQKNLRAVFHGHEHDHDGPFIEKGKPYLFDSHIGGNWGTAYRGYRIVEVFESGQVVTYQVNPGAGIRVNSNDLNS